MLKDGFRLVPGHDRRECRDVRLLYRLQAAEMFQQAPGCAFSHARDLPQFSGTVANLPALSMKSHRKPVRLIADQLHQV